MKLNSRGAKKIKPWRIKKSQYLLKDKWITVRADECVSSQGVSISPYYVLEYPHWVHMVVINKAGQVMITEQYRHAAGKVMYEIPCGTVDASDKNPLSAAKRELLEETGYDGNFVLAGITSPNPANHSNTIYTFLVTHATKRITIKRDEKEILNCSFLEIKQILKLIDKGMFQQALHISSLFLGMRKLQKTNSLSRQVDSRGKGKGSTFMFTLPIV